MIASSHDRRIPSVTHNLCFDRKVSRKLPQETILRFFQPQVSMPLGGIIYTYFIIFSRVGVWGVNTTKIENEE